MRQISLRQLVEENLKEGHAYSDYEFWMLFFLNDITLVNGKYADEKDEALRLIDEECCLTPCTLDNFYIYNGLRTEGNNDIHICPQKPPVNYYDALRAIFRYEGNVCEWEPSVKVLSCHDIFWAFYHEWDILLLTDMNQLSIKVPFDMEQQFIAIVSRVISNQINDALERIESELRKRYVIHAPYLRRKYYEANPIQAIEIDKQFKDLDIWSYSYGSWQRFCIYVDFSKERSRFDHIEWVNEFKNYEPEFVYAHCAYCVVYARLCNDLLQEIRKYFKSPDEFTLMVRLLAEWMKVFLDFDIFTMSMIYHE